MIRVLLLKPLNSRKQRPELIETLINQNGFDTRIVNNVKDCKDLHKVDICFLPCDKRGLRSIHKFKNGSTTINMYNPSRFMMNKASALSPNTVKFNM